MTDDEDSKLIEKLTTHPVEDLFNIEAGSTAIVITEPRETDLVVHNTYDDKDCEIETQFQEIFNRAMDAFDDSQSDNDQIPVEFKARNVEVSVMMLNAALSAAKEKANLKKHKDQVQLKTGPTSVIDNSTVNNTLMNVSTSDLIKQLAKEQSPINNQLPDVEEDEKSPVIEHTRTKVPRKKQTSSD